MRIPFFKTVAGVLAVATLALATPAMADGQWRHHHSGAWLGPAFAFGALGLATGAIIAANQQPYYPYYPAYGAYPPPPVYDGCWQRRPVYDRWGRYLGRQMVDVCN
jgi:hypothetical protein